MELIQPPTNESVRMLLTEHCLRAPVVFDSYYIETDLQLKLRQRSCAAAAVDRYVAERYGLEGFSRLVAEHFPSAVCEGGAALLPRQAPFANVETLTCALLCERLGLRMIVGSFGGDTFTVASIDKSAALKTKTIHWRRSAGGKIVSEIASEVLVPERLDELNGRVLDSIVTKSGQSLLDYHRRSLTELIPSVEIVDSSQFFYDCLRLSRRKPEHCFVRGESGRAVKLKTCDIDLDQGRVDVRPPAEWYYPLYFCMFTGQLLLLETYENPRGSVAQAKQLFMETSDGIRAGIGTRPGVIKIPPLSKEMLYLNGHVMDQGAHAMEDLRKCCAKVFEQHCPVGQEVDLLRLSHGLADEVIKYGGSNA